MTIGERVKQRRNELGLSQEELAHRMGNKSRASISAIETDRDDLTTARIRKLAKALETTPEYLVGWDDSVLLNESYPDAVAFCVREQLKPSQAPESLSKDEWLIIRKYRNADEQTQEMVRRILNYIEETNDV